MIKKETIEAILDAARIDEVVGEYVVLRKRGANMVGLCPFHNEKTPSFSVSPVKGIYKCFGCGKAGNALNFVMEHEHLSYPEGLRYLAKKYSIEIEEEKASPEEAINRDKRESLFVVSALAQSYFSEMLTESEEGKAIGKTYFEERGFTDDIIKKFQLGFSPSQRDAFSQHALAKGYSPEHLEATGLSIFHEGKPVDRFRGRVIFPIHNISSRVIGFGARILVASDRAPKYLNSPESDIYHKSNVLYGIHLARKAMAEKDNCYLVEGYTDVVSMHMAGVENVVASSGTSLTIEQIRLVRRYTPNITILYDGDTAGIKASFRGIDMILEEGMNVRIVLFPDKEDPDSFARKNRPAEVQEFIEKSARGFIDFKTSLLLRETGNDPVKRTALVKEIASTIAIVPDPLTRSAFARDCSARMNVDEQLLIHEINRMRKKHSEKKRPEEAQPEEGLPTEEYMSPEQYDPDDTEEFQEKDIVRLMMLYGAEEIEFEEEAEGKKRKVRMSAADYIIQEIQNDIEFENHSCKKIFDYYCEHRSRDEFPTDNSLTGHPDHEISHTAISMLHQSYTLSDHWLKHGIVIMTEDKKLNSAVRQAVLLLKLKKVEKKSKETLQLLKDAVSDEEMEGYQILYVQLDQIKREISKELGVVINK
ncbi:MAG: DNA primase [Bacteroidota bacterium]